MKKWIVFLSVLLTVQVGLAVLIEMNSNSYSAFQPKEKLLAFDVKKVDGVTIATLEMQLHRLRLVPGHRDPRAVALGHREVDEAVGFDGFVCRLKSHGRVSLQGRRE